MHKLYTCCDDPQCKPHQDMHITLKKWFPNPELTREGKRSYVAASVSEGWTKRRRDCFVEMVRYWPRGLKIQCPQGRVGSSPTCGTSCQLKFCDEWE